jgi:hypothetical protein
MLAGFKQLGLIASAGVVGLTSVILAVVYWEHLNLAFFKAQWNWLLANYPPIAAGALICLASIGLLAGLKLLTPGAKRLIRNGILKPVVIGLVVLVVILTCALPYQQMIVFTCLMLGVMGRKWLDGVVGRFMLWGLVPIFLFMVLSKPEFWDAITSSIHMLRDLGAQYSSELGWLGVTVAGCAWVVVGSIIFVRYIRLYPLTVPAMLFWLVVFVVEPWLKGMLVV